MGFSKKGSTSYAMALARIAIGVMFLFFAQYKLFGTGFAHGGYEKYVGAYANESAVSYYRPFLRLTLRHPMASGYAVAVAEALIGLSMVLGLWVRPFSLLGALFMLNLTLCTWWRVPYGSPYWQFLGNELDNIPLMFMFIIFFAHSAGQTLGLDK
jgi:thiosulfate dehydrogenase [quinone] large subunit